MQLRPADLQGPDLITELLILQAGDKGLALAPQLFAECPTLTKEILESHHIHNEAIIEEIKALGVKIAQGGVQQPGATGSAPGSGGTPAAVTGGMANGVNNVRGGG